MDLDEVAHFEPPHKDLCCLQILLFSSLVLKELCPFHSPNMTEILLKRM